MGKVTAVVGAQYGSEGKGAVVRELAFEYGCHVRTGSPQAGHTIFHEGKEYKMRCIPCGWVNPDAILVLGAGAVINARVLEQEIRMIEEAGYSLEGRLFIDANATALTPNHERREGHTTGDINKRIGSTGEGVGAARVDRLQRDDALTRIFGELYATTFPEYISTSTATIINAARKSGDNVLLEGTQGFGLSVTHGAWPFTTSHDTTAAQLCADAGVPAQALTDVILVARTFPIRVAGNSGPMKNEMSWEEFRRYIGVDVPQEFTTVTKLPRRIGVWDGHLMARACTINEPTEVALTFMDYLSPDDAGKMSFDDLSPRARSFVDYVERMFGTKVKMVGTGYSKERGWTCARR